MKPKGSAGYRGGRDAGEEVAQAHGALEPDQELDPESREHPELLPRADEAPEHD